MSASLQSQKRSSRSAIERQHTCLGCGCVFKYRLDLHNPWEQTLALMTGDSNDPVQTHPCPECGLIQPEMAMRTKFVLPLGALASFFALMLFASLSWLNLASSLLLAAHFAGAVFLLLALLMLGTLLSNPNGDRKANLAEAQQEMAQGNLALVSAATGDKNGRARRNVTPWHLPGMALVLVGGLAFGYPIVGLTGAKDQPLNPELTPSVIQPGDTVRFTFPEGRATGISGNIWRGTPSVRVLNASQLKIAEQLHAKGSDRQWGDSMKVSSNCRNVPVTPTIEFTVPADQRLAGETLRLSITLHVVYPVLMNPCFQFNKQFANETATMTESLAVKVAHPGSLSQTRSMYLAALALSVGSVVGGFWLTILETIRGRHRSTSEILASQLPPVQEHLAPMNPLAAPMHTPLVSDDPVAPPGVDLDRIDRSRWGERWRR